MTTISEGDIWRQLFALADRCQPIITKYTVCIYAWQEKISKLGIAGTGVLLRVADRHFLISAAHVMDYTFYHQMQFYAQPNKDPIPPIPLLFIARRCSIRPPGLADTDPDLRNGDPLDICIAELTPETAEKLAVRHRFLSLSDFDPLPVQNADGICVFGYPSALAILDQCDIAIENWPLMYATTPLQKEPEERDKDKEILLYYSEESSDAQGGSAVAPKPYGFSGCGIWRLSRAPVLPGQTWVNDIRLVGIQHRWRPQSGYIVGTSVCHIVDMLWGCYPDLRPVLGMWRR